MASMLLSLDHTDRLYGADDLTNALNVAADAPDGARVDATMLLRAFLNEAADEFELGYRDYSWIGYGLQVGTSLGRRHNLVRFQI